MRYEGAELHSETDNARAGSTPNIVRWVLGISLAAAIIALSAIWIFGAAQHEEDEAVASAADRSERNAALSDTDSIVSDDADRFAPATPADAVSASENAPANANEN